jgi:hypothetical protein
MTVDQTEAIFLADLGPQNPNGNLPSPEQKSLPYKPGDTSSFIEWLKTIDGVIRPKDESARIIEKQIRTGRIDHFTTNHLFSLTDPKEISLFLSGIAQLDQFRNQAFLLEGYKARVDKESKRHVYYRTFNTLTLDPSEIAHPGDAKAFTDLETLIKANHYRITDIQPKVSPRYWLGQGMEEVWHPSGDHPFPQNLRSFSDVLASQGAVVLVVGGRNRDYLLRKFQFSPPPGESDIDLVIVGFDSLKPIAELINNQELGLAVESENHDYGIITAKTSDGTKVDIALSREEIWDSGSFKRSFGWSIGIDALRRGFTIDACYVAADGTIYGIEGAYDDLRYLQLRIIDPEHFKQDPKRLVRALNYILNGFSLGGSYNGQDNAGNVLREMILAGKLDKQGDPSKYLLNALTVARDPAQAFIEFQRIGLVDRYFLPHHPNNAQTALDLDRLRQLYSDRQDWIVELVELGESESHQIQPPLAETAQLELRQTKLARLALAYAATSSIDREFIVKQSPFKTQGLEAALTLYLVDQLHQSSTPVTINHLIDRLNQLTFLLDMLPSEKALNEILDQIPLPNPENYQGIDGAWDISQIKFLLAKSILNNESNLSSLDHPQDQLMAVLASN